MFSSQTVHSKHHSIFIPIDRPVKPVGLRHPRFSPIDMTGEMGGVGQEREHVREVAKSLIKCMAHVQGSVVTCKRCKGILMPEVIHCRPRSSSIDSTTSGISEKDAERAVGAGLAVEGVSKYSSRIKAFLGGWLGLRGVLQVFFGIQPMVFKSHIFPFTLVLIIILLSQLMFVV